MAELEVTGPPADAVVDGATSTDEPAVESAPEGAPEAAPPAEDWRDRYLRLAAEFDNFRKRSAREFGELVRTAERDLITELTEVLDNLGRAVDNDHKGESVEQFARGVALIRDQLWQVLERRGLERMQTVGLPFDPEQHDAMMRLPSDEHGEGTVAQEVAPGYRLGGKVIRHAKVIVSQGKAEESQEP
jgi:molecular chaperone GrpE